jgi:N utilization substance protein A
LASIYQSIEILGKEKGIDPQVILDAVKDALVVAARKHFRTNEDMVVEFDAKGGLQLFVVKRVVETVSDPLNELTLEQARRLDPKAEIGGEIRIPKNADALGRISAQTAKQVILQKVREAERETIYSEFSDRVGELVNCTVKRIEGQDLVVDMGKTEARLPKKEQSKLESFTVGDRIRCVIRSVEKTGKNAGVIVSRADAQLVVRLFEQEVPEIYDNTVIIKGCAREAGERTKIAVWSRDRDVDSVGACVGMKGMRVQSIIRELRGEKIDIIEYSEDPVVFATHALSPAKITRVAVLSSQDRHMEVIVDDSQLSLAIGKKGQNVRLAAKLMGWKIDIKSEEEKRQEVESAMAALVVPGAPVSVLSDYGLEEAVLDALFQAGVTTVERLGAMTPEELEAVPGLDLDAVADIQTAVVAYYSQFEHAEGAEGAVAEAVAEPAAEAAVEPAAGEEAVEPAPEETGSGEGAAEETAAGEAADGGEAVAGEESLVEDESARIKSPVEGAEGE